MRRRLLLALLGGAALLPGAAAAQQRRRVGMLWLDKPEMTQIWDAALRRGLAAAGFAGGPDLVFVPRYAGGDLARLPALAGELAAAKPDVIVAAGSVAALAAHRSAPEIPVVAILDGDPVALLLFRSYARPDGMVTGLTLTAGSDALLGKNFQVLRDLLPGLRGIGFMFSPDIPGAVRSEPGARAAVEGLGLAYAAFPVRSMDDIKGGFAATGIGALFLYNSPLLRNNLPAVVDLAIAAKKPVMTIWRGYTKRGFFVSYGLDVPDLWQRLGDYAAKILAGAKPADLPVEQPTKFELVINLKTAKALGLTVPQSLLQRADEVIE